MKKILGLFCLLLATVASQLCAWEIPQVPSWNKIDVAPAYVHMDILESGETIHSLDMAAGRIDTSFIFGGGWTVKPMAMIARGDHGQLYTVGSGFGYTLPLSECLAITPIGGISYSYFSAHFNHNFGFGPIFLKRSYKTWTPYAGLDAVFTLGNGWRIGGSLYYAWASSKTTINPFARNQKSEAQGFISAITLEKDLTDNLSFNVGAGYNNSMTKEKHGLRGYGFKAGFSYWF